MMNIKTIVESLAFLLMMLFVGGCGASDTLDNPPHVIEEPLVSTEVNSSDEIKKGPPYKDLEEMFTDSWWVIEEANSSVESPREPIYIHFAFRFIAFDAESFTEEELDDGSFSTGTVPIAAFYYKINGEFVEDIKGYRVSKDEDSNKTILSTNDSRFISNGLHFESNDVNLSSDENIFNIAVKSYTVQKYKNLILRRVKDIPFEPEKLHYTNIVNESQSDYDYTVWIGEYSNLDEAIKEKFDSDPRNVIKSNDFFLTRFSNVNYNVQSTYRKYRDYDLEHTRLSWSSWIKSYTPESKEAPYNMRSVTQIQILQTNVPYEKNQEGEYLSQAMMILKGTVLNPDTNRSEDVVAILSGLNSDKIDLLLANKAKPIKSEYGHVVKKEIRDFSYYRSKMTILPWNDYEEFVSNIDVEKGIKKSDIFEHPKKLFSTKIFITLEEAPREDGNSDLYFSVFNMGAEEEKKYPIAFSFVTDFESFGKMLLVEKMVKQK